VRKIDAFSDYKNTGEKPGNPPPMG